jgi:hypothetical protein
MGFFPKRNACLMPNQECKRDHEPGENQERDHIRQQVQHHVREE